MDNQMITRHLRLVKSSGKSTISALVERLQQESPSPLFYTPEDILETVRTGAISRSEMHRFLRKEIKNAQKLNQGTFSWLR